MTRGVLAAAVAGCVAAGGCGGSDDEAKARKVVRTYFAALVDKDAAGACRTFTEQSRERLAEFGHEQLKTDESCSAVIGKLLASPAGAGLAKLGDAEVSSVEVDGRKAEVRVKGLDRPIDLVRSDGRWRIDSTPSGETD